MKHTSTHFTLALLMAVSAAGCGSDYPETVDVSGSVTLDGTPVPNALVTFMPLDGQRSGSGETDENGRFTLTTFESGDGAVPGSHQVAIYPKEPPPMSGDVTGPMGNAESGSKYTPPFPARYGLPKESGLTAEVTPDGENDFTFDMRSKG